MNSPLVSVILPAYNAEKFIGAAIRSILDQTYTNLELIVINDGSTDGTEQEIQKISDLRLRYLQQENRGMARTLNHAISLCRGELIARQDADDISLPERLEKQVNFLQQNSNCGVVGTWAKVIDEAGRETGHRHAHPCDKNEVRFYLLFDNPIVHSSVVFLKKAVDECGTYDEKLSPLAQDFEYWHRIVRKFDVVNLPEYLQLYRQIGTGISASTANFTCVVADQAAQHLFSSGVLSATEALELAQAYHGCQVIPEKEKQYEASFAKIAARLSQESRKHIADPHRFKLRRSIYNFIINDPAAGSLKHLRYKLKRRLLFMKFAV